jgi:putative Ca2+/H+ antiporter (TMEM165/GDT1 family)
VSVEVAASSALAVLLAEVGDKTMLSTVLFAINTRRYGLVLLVSTLAFILANTLVVLIGYFTLLLVDLSVLELVAGVILVATGLWIALSGGAERSEDTTRYSVLACFTTVLLMEMGDKTQLAVFSLTVLYAAPVYVLLCGALGYLAANVIGVLVAKTITSRVEWGRVRLVAGVLMALLGAITVTRALTS